METTTQSDVSHKDHHDAHEENGHVNQHFLTKYVFSSDHKVIGIQYGVTSLLFLLIGFLLIMGMRWQIAKPGEPIPVMGAVLENVYSHNNAGEPVFKDGIMSSDAYNQFGAMHGTIMVFFVLTAGLSGTFSNFLIPLQIGARDMASGFLNMLYRPIVKKTITALSLIHI